MLSVLGAERIMLNNQEEVEEVEFLMGKNTYFVTIFIVCASMKIAT